MRRAVVLVSPHVPIPNIFCRCRGWRGRGHQLRRRWRRRRRRRRRRGRWWWWWWRRNGPCGATPRRTSRGHLLHWSCTGTRIGRRMRIRSRQQALLQPQPLILAAPLPPPVLLLRLGHSPPTGTAGVAVAVGIIPLLRVVRPRARPYYYWWPGGSSRARLGHEHHVGGGRAGAADAHVVAGAAAAAAVHAVALVGRLHLSLLPCGFSSYMHMFVANLACLLSHDGTNNARWRGGKWHTHEGHGPQRSKQINEKLQMAGRGRGSLGEATQTSPTRLTRQCGLAWWLHPKSFFGHREKIHCPFLPPPNPSSQLRGQYDHVHVQQQACR
jgi:hypothetical protein